MKSNTGLWVALIAVAIIAIGSYFTPKAGPKSGAILDTSYFDTFQAGASGGFVDTYTTSLNEFFGISLFQNIVQGVLGYSLTQNTAVQSATSTITSAQWCGTTSVLIPVGATTTTYELWPNATTTYTACGVAASGSWETQIVENESSFPMIIATSSTGWQFLYDATTTALGTKYPVQVPASTTATFIGIPTSSSSWEILLNNYAHATGQ